MSRSNEGGPGVEVLICADTRCGRRYAIRGFRPDRGYRCKRCGARLGLAPGSGRGVEPDEEAADSAADLTAVEPSPAAGESAATLLDSPDGAIRLRGSPAPREAGTFGRFLDPQTIARGGMGVILRAIDPDLGRAVALKILTPGGEAREEVRSRFVREARVTGQLEHPNIAPVYEMARTPEGGLCFAMKLVRGRSLAEILAEMRPSGDREEVLRARSRLLSAFLKVCDAVAYAHSRGVVHRDLKPANIMVGEFGEVLVMDWGIAKILGREDVEKTDLARRPSVRELGGESERTLEGSILGTPAYMSPEQAEGAVDRIDARSDVYSLGAVLYEILTLSPPCEGRNLAEILARKVSAQWVAPSERSPESRVPRELDAVVKKAMAPSRSLRYQKVEELKEDLEAYLSGHTLAAAKYSTLQVALKWGRRHRPAVFGTVAVLFALVGATGAFLVQRARAADESHDQGTALWMEAEREAPFNPAAPQDFFRRHVAAVQAMGRALQDHPWPPASWKEEVATRTAELQERAESVGDWTLARILAESAETWGAIDPREKEERLAGIERAEDLAAERDRARLGEVLGRIREAEKRGGGRSGFLPGEMGERARRLARAPGAPLTLELLARLGSPEGETSPACRRLLIETLGRRGDVTSETAGANAASLARRFLSEAAAGAPMPADEIAAWVMASARLRARAAEALPWLPGALDALGAAQANVQPVLTAIGWGRELMKRIEGQIPLPCPSQDPHGFQAALDEIGDWTAASAGSGSRYTRTLLDLARDDRALSNRELVFVYDQLGLAGDPLPPDPGQPELAALPLLREAFASLPDGWILDDLPSGIEREEWERARVRAVAAAINLSRMEDAWISDRLLVWRVNSREDSWFWKETALASALAPSTTGREGTTAGQLAFDALAHLERADFQGAIDLASQALELDPSCAFAYLLRGNARRSMEEFPAALEDLTRVLELEPGWAEGWIDRGNVFVSLEDLDHALADYTRAIEVDPRSGKAYAYRGRVRLVRGDLEGAREDLGRGVELEPEFAPAWFHRGSYRRGTGDLQGAMADFDRAVALDPALAIVRHDRAELLRELGDRKGAIEDLTRLLELDPGSAEAYDARGVLRHELGDLAGALQDFDRALDLDPRSAPAYSNRSLVRQRAGYLEGAVEDATRALAIDPELASAWFNRGGARRAMGDLAGALEDLTRAVELDGGLAGAWSDRGLVRMAQGDVRGAIEDYTRALEADPGLATAHFNRGVARTAASDVPGALADYDRAIELDPGLGGAYGNRGALRQMGGDLLGAVADYSRAIELEPALSRHRANRAVARNGLGDPEGALADADEAIRLDAGMWQAWLQRGVALALTGRRDGAVASFREAVRLAPAQERAGLEETLRPFLGR